MDLEKNNNYGMQMRPYLWAGGIVVIISNIIIVYLAYSKELNVFPLGFLLLITGAIFESMRVTREYKVVLTVALIAYLLSFCSFIPLSKENEYSFSTHFEIWPYVFLFLFILGGLLTWGNKTMTKLTEGITLIQSLAIIYFIISIENIFYLNWVFKSIILLFLLATLFPLYHAFTYHELSRKSRLILSLFSSIIMLIFAIDNCIKVFSGKIFDTTLNLNQQLITGLNYFLLGISAIYFAQNFLMLFSYLTVYDKDTYKEKVKAQIARLNEEHIQRFSDKQVNVLHSLFCLIFAGTLFSINYYFNFIAPITAIWLVFILFPILVNLISGNKKSSPERAALEQ